MSLLLGIVGIGVLAAEPLDPAVQRRLIDDAVALEHGEGVPKDEREAARIYCRVAREGNAEALFSLGWMYANARGVERDDAVAALLFGLAAEAGHDHAAKLRVRFSNAAAVSPPECLSPPAVLQEISGTDGSGTSADGFPVPAKIRELVYRLAPEYQVRPKLALAVIQAESNFDPNAVSPKNAQGLMQLIPETAQRFNVRKPFDPEQNLRGGLAYLRWLLAYFRGRVALVAAGYNAGEGTVDRYRGVPPYPETRGYVKRILALYQEGTHPFDPRFAPASQGSSQVRGFR